MEIRIKTAKNGFIVYPAVPEHCAVNEGEIVVFESFKAMAEYLEKYFGPIIEVEVTE